MSDGCDPFAPCGECGQPWCRDELSSKQARIYAEALRLRTLIAGGMTERAAATAMGLAQRRMYRRLALIRTFARLPLHKPRVTESEHRQMQALRAQGWTYGQIAVKVRRPETTVYERLRGRRMGCGYGTPDGLPVAPGAVPKKRPALRKNPVTGPQTRADL